MKTAARVVLVSSLLTLCAGFARAELIVALTPPSALTPDAASLLTFASEDPSTILSAVPVSGLQAGESVLGIDVRPATAELYAITNQNRLYVLNPSTGAATLRATLAAAQGDVFTTVSGTRFAVDFNPQADRLRVVSDTQQNLRINPVTGAVITDTPVAYATGDPSFGRDPEIVDAAYDNNDTNAGTPTTLFLLEQGFYNTKTLPDGSTLPALSLVRQGGDAGTPSPNGGLLTTLGSFGRNGVMLSGFDVGPSGKAFACVRLVAESGGAPFYALVKLLLAADPADPVALHPGKDESLGYIGDARLAVDDIAVLQSVQFDLPIIAATEPSVGTSNITVTVSRHGGTAGAATVRYSTRNGTAVAGTDFLTAQGVLNFAVGEASKTFQVTLLGDGTPGFPEEDETFEILLTDATTATLGGTSVATVRISANDFTDTRGPVVTYFGLTGPSRGVTGGVVEFNEDLDEASAENVANYTLFGTTRSGSKQPVTLTSAVYDANTRSVTLVAAPFVQTELKRLTLVVLAKASVKAPSATGIRDIAGNLLDGNANGIAGDKAVFKFKVTSGTTIKFKDVDGDVATIEITGAGSLDANVLNGKDGRTQFWILDSIPLRSTLTGSVKPSLKGDGIVVISEIIGLDKKEFAPLLSNPSFRVNSITFSTNAVGRSGR